MANITFIGNNAAGMTTYLAALAAYSQIAKNNNNLVEIDPQNPESRMLKEKFEYIILQGCDFEKTPIAESLDDYPFYAFRLKINPKFRTEFTIRDFTGAYFHQLTSPVNKSSNYILEYIEELAIETTGVLVLLDGLTKERDILYFDILKNLLDLSSSYLNGRKIRIAIVLNKCERGGIWTRRFHPENDIFRLYLPRTRKVLRDSFLSEHCQFFAISIFGVLGKHDPRPNRITATRTNSF